jgi:hypothetical protein
MSSSSAVSIIIQKETAYDVPPNGDWGSFRLASESMDGKPDPKKSPEIRNDRQSAGTKVLSASSGGGLNGLFVRDTVNDELIGGCMYSDLSAEVSTTDTIAIDTATNTLTFSTIDPSAFFSLGDMISLSGFADQENNALVVITAINATTITYAGGELMTDTLGAGTEVATRPLFWDIGKKAESFAIEKKFSDVNGGSTLIIRGNVLSRWRSAQFMVIML